jgi:predicted RNA binding protein YcfA (HicA-like mRNA interferase family)
MSNLPVITAQRLIKVLEKLGFELIRKKGSHQFLRHPYGGCIVVPVHRGETIGLGLLAQIIRDCQTNAEDLRKPL